MIELRICGWPFSATMMIVAVAAEEAAAPAEEVPAVGPFVEFFGHGTHHFDRPFRIGLCEPDIAEREYEAAFAVFEHAADGSHRAEPFGSGKRMLGHLRTVCRSCGPIWMLPDGGCGFFSPVYAAGFG